MSNIQMIQRLCALLDDACNIIRQQAELMALHGIETEDGSVEEKRTALLETVEREGWSP